MVALSACGDGGRRGGQRGAPGAGRRLCPAPVRVDPGFQAATDPGAARPAAVSGFLGPRSGHCRWTSLCVRARPWPAQPHGGCRTTLGAPGAQLFARTRSRPAGGPLDHGTLRSKGGLVGRVGRRPGRARSQSECHSSLWRRAGDGEHQPCRHRTGGGDRGRPRPIRAPLGTGPRHHQFHPGLSGRAVVGSPQSGAVGPPGNLRRLAAGRGSPPGCSPPPALAPMAAHARRDGHRLAADLRTEVQLCRGRR